MRIASCCTVTPTVGALSAPRCALSALRHFLFDFACHVVSEAAFLGLFSLIFWLSIDEG